MAEIRVERKRRPWGSVLALLIVLAVVAGLVYYLFYYQNG
jgi:hypothetical protein